MPKKETCQFRGQKFGCRIIFDHYGDCLQKVHEDKSGYLVRFFSHGISGDVYFMYVIIGEKCKFSLIDKLLRQKWCECCDHLSTFYECCDSNKNIEIPKNKMIKNYADSDNFMYTYDEGSTTTIYFEILKKLNGDEKTNNIELLLRNDPPKIKCDICKKSEASFFVSFDATLSLCEKCSENIEIDGSEIHKIVNSPRSGICEYK